MAHEIDTFPNLVGWCLCMFDYDTQTNRLQVEETICSVPIQKYRYPTSLIHNSRGF